MPEQFTTEDLSQLNDLRRRIVNGESYTDEEVAQAIALFRQKRVEATQPKEKKKKTSVKTISLDDLLEGDS